MKYILFNIFFVGIFVYLINLLEIVKIIEEKNSNFFSILYLSLLKLPSIVIEIIPFVIVISTAFLYRGLISNNELNVFVFSVSLRSQSNTPIRLVIFLLIIVFSISLWSNGRSLYQLGKCNSSIGYAIDVIPIGLLFNLHTMVFMPSVIPNE